MELDEKLDTGSLLAGMVQCSKGTFTGIEMDYSSSLGGSSRQLYPGIVQQLVALLPGCY